MGSDIHLPAIKSPSQSIDERLQRIAEERNNIIANLRLIQVSNKSMFTKTVEEPFSGERVSQLQEFLKKVDTRRPDYFSLTS
jgi:hypothetical protein